MKVVFKVLFFDANHFDFNRSTYNELFGVVDDWINEKLNVECEHDWGPMGYNPDDLRMEPMLWCEMSYRAISEAESADLVVFLVPGVLYMPALVDEAHYSGYCLTEPFGWNMNVILVSRGLYKLPDTNTIENAMMYNSTRNWITRVISHELLHHFTKRNVEVDEHFDETEHFKGYLFQSPEPLREWL